MLDVQNISLKDKKVVISGSGNVAQYACEKVMELGGVVVTLSDSSGYIYDEDGIDEKKLKYIFQLKNVKRGRISEYAKKFNCTFSQGTPWSVKCDIALPCATQNELTEKDAELLVANKCIAVAEGANMPCTIEAVNHFQNHHVLFGPGKASNAGGVSVSGLEMSQNSLRMHWSRQEVDDKLKDIMKNIHEACIQYGQQKNYVDYVKGANIAGFIKVADSMLDQGVV